MITCDKDGNTKGAAISLEDHFEGLKYSKCEGLDTIGAAKNIYEEKYADSDNIRVYMPVKTDENGNTLKDDKGNTLFDIKNESTIIKLTLFFVGKNRINTRDTFNGYIRNGFHKYWDTARKKMFQFYVTKELPVGEEKWYGSTPYLKCEYTLNNVTGKAISSSDNPLNKKQTYE
jgi:hypothetical protein